jgi:Mg2+/Co2+ transporter CorC
MKVVISKLSIVLSFAPSIAAYSVGKNRVFVGTPVHQNRRLVQDCMTPLSRLCTLTESATVDEAVYLLLKLDVSGAPVINENTGELLGVVSTFDFLQQEAGDGALLPIEGTMENVKDYLNHAKKVSFLPLQNFIESAFPMSFMVFTDLVTILSFIIQDLCDESRGLDDS